MGNNTPTEKTEKELLLEYLDQILNTESSKLTGKIMKRFEILENRDMLKKEVKELIYEAFREMKDIFYAYGNGLETFKFEFKTREK